VGISQSRLEGLAELIERWAEEKAASAALCVARHGMTVLKRGFGGFMPLDGRENGERATQADTIFLIASLTKPIVASAIALLIERGQVLLDDPVSALIPEFGGEDRRKMRVHHLLMHTSGLPDMLPENVELRQRHAGLEEFVRQICTTPLLFAPGTNCRYQSMGIALLGEIIQRVAGVPLREFLRREFFAPLGMGATALGLGDLPQERVARVRLPEAEAQHDWNWNSPYWRDLGAPWGGMHATVGDYAIFLQMMLNGGGYGNQQFLGKMTVDTALTNHLAAMSGVSEKVKLEQAWGLGWRLNCPRGAFHFAELASPRTFGHAGATGTTAWADPESGLVCVFFTNRPQDERMLKLVSNAVAGTIVD
jgi:CubicO group peptidase (beta-lactamase class C family)